MMKRFIDFLSEATSKKKSRSSDYKKSYAEKVASVRDNQRRKAEEYKDRVHQIHQKRQEVESRNKEEEKENQEYIKHIDNLKKEIKSQVKKEYGIKD